MSAFGLLRELDSVGADARRGGYSRHCFDAAEIELREWFAEAAGRVGLDVQLDGNGNLWAWWGDPGPDAVVTGSHLDSVPGGGAFDGPLGVASALAAVGELRTAGFTPTKPLAVVVFAEEEGGRFGVPCLGSRLLTGATPARHGLALRDQHGRTFAEAASVAGLDPGRMGRDAGLLGRIGCFVELHVEQGRGLVDTGAPVGVASSILAHGRWRFRFRGQGNHAGATLLADRHDPMLPAAEVITAARRVAAGVPDARATVGRVSPNPGGTNVIASTVDLWLDARAPREQQTRAVVDEVTAAAHSAAAEEGCTVEVSEESYADEVRFDAGLANRIAGLLGDAPQLATGAGHDAGVLATEVPTAMLFVRNPTGISHAPEEHAEPADCAAGERALATVLRELAG